MSRRRLTPILLALTLAACQAGGPTGPAKRSPAPKPSAERTPAPTGATPDGTPGPGASAGGPLQAIPGAVKLTGVLRVDGAYALGAGGRLVGGAIAPPGAGPDAGFGLIANNGAALISDHGVGLIGNNGGAVVSNAGGAVVSNNGGAIISDSGASLIGKVKYGLAQAAAPAPGTALPAAGMWVGLVSLRDGRPLPVGQDAAGKPVYTVATGADGGFTLHLPADEKQNVGIVAVAPGTADPRLAYGFVTAPRAAAALALDEDAALASDLLRHAVVARLEQGFLLDQQLVTPPDADAAELAALAQLGPIIERLRAAAREAGIAKLDAAARRRVEQRFADGLCAAIDLAAIEVPAQGGRPAGPALVALAEGLRAMREAAGRMLAKDPKAFDARPYMIAINERRKARGAAPLAIRRAADVGELIVREYLGPSQAFNTLEIPTILADLGLPSSTDDALKAAGNAIFLAEAFALVADAAVQDGVVEAVRRATEAEVAAPRAPEPTPAPPVGLPAAPEVAEPAVEVVAIAGTGEPGTQDGPGASAGFNRPVGLAIDGTDPARPVMYVTDGANHVVRRIALAEPGAPVTTIAGKAGSPGDANGPGDQARFRFPVGLAFVGGPDPMLYVSELDGFKIRRVRLGGPGPATVETVAGATTSGAVDGPAATARFAGLTELAYDGRGALYAVEQLGTKALRKIDLLAAGGPEVTTLVDLDTPLPGLPPPKPTAVGAGVTLDAAGRLYLSMRERNAIYVRDPDGTWRAATVGAARNGDGFWTNGIISAPGRLLAAPDGTVLVSQEFAKRVRRLTPAPTFPGFAVTSAVAGGPDRPFPFGTPAGMALAPDGTLYLADQGVHRIWAIRRK